MHFSSLNTQGVTNWALRTAGFRNSRAVLSAKGDTG